MLEEIRRGNVPASHRTLVRLDFSGESRSGQKHDVTLWVMPDYVSIGDDADHVRVPMTPLTAQLVADHLGYLLPTSRMVDLIHQKAAVRLQPYPLPPSERMVLMEEFARHSRLIDRQLGEQGLVGRGAMLVAGHKKDIVLSNRLLSAPHRVAIYGWHDPRAQPIQPLSTIHGDWYADYSHGVRLVSTTMLLDGTPMRVEEALHDVDLAQLLSDEGPIVRTRYPTELGFGKPRGLPGLAPAPAPTPTPTQHLGPEQALAFYQGIPSTAR
ncbi:hypothetical protein [Chondromyces apiculatus]|uniref:Uncharacterized protein n=1 Tax=Chondromyces apiculatus DSM 436 TaxID=1192034 RepID=A0A017TAB7_9BACT|nr:hypothetical protein [Chondromyces apiculatus]EYF06169.1 Hypothetical protein CAP_2359 [Chondromyces apiculatus DSM 436]